MNSEERQMYDEYRLGRWRFRRREKIGWGYFIAAMVLATVMITIFCGTVFYTLVVDR